MFCQMAQAVVLPGSSLASFPPRPHFSAVGVNIAITPTTAVAGEIDCREYVIFEFPFPITFDSSQHTNHPLGWHLLSALCKLCEASSKNLLGRGFSIHLDLQIH